MIPSFSSVDSSFPILSVSLFVVVYAFFAFCFERGRS